MFSEADLSSFYVKCNRIMTTFVVITANVCVMLVNRKLLQIEKLNDNKFKTCILYRFVSLCVTFFEVAQ